MNNKIPPPVWAILTILAMKLLSMTPWAFALSLGQWRYLGIALFAIGVMIDVMSIWAFRQHQTTVSPLKPHAATALVQTGTFQYSRNPMYVGIVFILCGWGIWLGSVVAFLMIPLFIWVITTWQIKPEEVALRSLFGDTYTEYCARVRRWL